MPKVCTLCCDLAHRVEGEYCAKCGLKASDDSVGLNASVAHFPPSPDRYGKSRQQPLMRLTCRCGKEFRQTNPNQIHCSERCRNSAANDVRRMQRAQAGLIE